MHVNLPTISLIKSKNDNKSNEYIFLIKLHRDTTSENAYLYELKLALFDNSDSEEVLFLIRNFNMNIKASGTLLASSNIQYLRTLVCEEVLRQVDTLSAGVGIATPKSLCLLFYFLVYTFSLLVHCPRKSARGSVEQ